ncbi:T-box transcription factor T homolog 1-like [Mercenaria mercenaria]|uniref:T-box transcription factor T homolog 1-like n=1 Tax=Mercenaria mercenaria TaxID=6596 RepID=UPI001E1DAF78|nr:T-box transcription factor T homolog 1-like [Mercenaria mercenaria]
MVLRKESNNNLNCGATSMKHQQMNLNQLLDVVSPDLNGAVEKCEGLESKCAVKLEEKELWSKFKEYTNEMIVTKNGRRMFPVFKTSISGLDPNSMYTILLDFVQVENHRWKYVNGEWVAGGKAEPSVPNCVYVHPDSPNFGSHWMKESISFSKVKLTNKLNGGGQIMLNSLHKYEPRLHVVKVTANAQKKRISSFNFPETQFIAVTAYQNEEITALKIKHNPFAKAFLDAKERPEQRDYLEESLDNQQRSFSHLTGTWYLPPGGALVPPPAHQFPNALNLSNPHCDRLSFRNSRHAPYSHPYQRRSPPSSLSRDMTPNLPVLNIGDNWSQFSTTAGMLNGNPVASQSQYGMWMGTAMSGNISPNQSCSMPYLRNAGYSIPSSTSPTSVSSVSGSMLSSHATYDQCDISNFVPTPSRDISRNSNWSPLTPPPI